MLLTWNVLSISASIALPTPWATTSHLKIPRQRRSVHVISVELANCRSSPYCRTGVEADIEQSHPTHGYSFCRYWLSQEATAFTRSFAQRLSWTNRRVECGYGRILS